MLIFLARVVLSFILLYIIGYGFVTLRNVWTKPLDLEATFPKPFGFIYFKREDNRQVRLQYSWYNLPSKYEKNLLVDGVPWQKDYHEYLLRIKNVSEGVDIHDMRLDLDIPGPGGIVFSKIQHEEGCDGLNILTKDTKGHVVKKIDGIAIKSFTNFSNNLHVNAVQLFSNGYFEIKIIAKLINVKPQNGFWGVKFKYQDLENNWIEKEEKYYIVPIEESQTSFSIDIDNPIIGKHTRSIAFIPFKPLKFTNDGKVIPGE